MNQSHLSLLRAITLIGGLMFAATTTLSCEEPKSCGSDADCREGYRCDLKIYVGECVEIVRVVRCGDDLCQAPEVCVRGEVCAIVDRDDMRTGGVTSGGVDVPLAGVSSGGASAGMSAGATTGGSSGAEAGIVAGSSAGSTSGMSAGTAAGSASGDESGAMSSADMDDVGPPRDMFVDPLDRDQGGQACESACDCTPGLACAAGVCTSLEEPVYCCGDSFCPPGESCETPSGVRDLCLDARCETACDCRSGLSCISGTCELGAEPVFCCDSGSCPSGMACDTARGVRSMCPSAACQTACDCSAGQRCVDGVCALQGDPLFCCESSTCPPGGICQSSTGMASTCEASSPCESACDCTPGMGCEGGLCRLLDAPIFCCEAASCPAGERCESEVGGPLLFCE